MGEVLLFSSNQNQVKTLRYLGGILNSLDDLGYERYSVCDDENCTVELEHLSAIVSIHFTPKYWSPQWYKYYIELWISIQEEMLKAGITRVHNFIPKCEEKKVKLHELFGFEAVAEWEEYYVMLYIISDPREASNG